MQDIKLRKKLQSFLRRKTNTRTCLACSALLFSYLKTQLKKGQIMDWLSEFYLFFQNNSRRPPPVNLEKVLYRCFKEYFSLKVSINFTRKLQQVNFINLQVKEDVQFVQKVTFEPLIDFKQNHYGNWKCYKSCYF